MSAPQSNPIYVVQEARNTSGHPRWHTPRWELNDTKTQETTAARTPRVPARNSAGIPLMLPGGTCSLRHPPHPPASPQPPGRLRVPARANVAGPHPRPRPRRGHTHLHLRLRRPLGVDQQVVQDVLLPVLRLLAGHAALPGRPAAVPAGGGHAGPSRPPRAATATAPGGGQTSAR